MGHHCDYAQPYAIRAYDYRCVPPVMVNAAWYYLYANVGLCSALLRGGRAGILWSRDVHEHPWISPYSRQDHGSSRRDIPPRWACAMLLRLSRSCCAARV